MHESRTAEDGGVHGDAWVPDEHVTAFAGHVDQGEPRSDAAHRSTLELAVALGTEMHNLRHLLETLKLQRTAIAKSDVDAINENIFVMRRLLLTLSEARRYRQLVVQQLGAPPDMAPSRGNSHAAAENEVAPPWGSASIQQLRDELSELAAEVAREVETNRKILFGVVAAGEELIRLIVSGAVPTFTGGRVAASTVASGGAGRPARGNKGGSEGALINRVI